MKDTGCKVVYDHTFEGVRVETYRFGMVTLTGTVEYCGDSVRWEARLKDPGVWSLHNHVAYGPFMALYDFVKPRSL